MSTLNIFYFTDKCDFRCTYCYESMKDRKFTKGRVTKEQIEKFIDDALEKDGHYPLFILFGGEPFLEYDMMKYFYQYATKRSNGTAHYTIYTNGRFFWKDSNTLDFIRNFKNTSVFLSYDGKSNYKRIYQGKDSTPYTLKVIQKLSGLYQKGLIDFGISFTVGEDNFDTCDKDIELLLSTFKMSKISIQLNIAELEKHTNTEPNLVPRVVHEKLKDVFLKFRVPICELMCDLCGKCKSGDPKDHEYYHYGFKDKILTDFRDKYSHTNLF